MMKLNDYFPRWRVELKWWGIVVVRSFIGSQPSSDPAQVSLGGYRPPAQPLPPASTRYCWSEIVVGAFFNEETPSSRHVSGRGAGRVPLSRSTEDIDLLLSWRMRASFKKTNAASETIPTRNVLSSWVYPSLSLIHVVSCPTRLSYFSIPKTEK